jgi:hypothetical protein
MDKPLLRGLAPLFALALLAGCGSSGTGVPAPAGPPGAAVAVEAAVGTSANRLLRSAATAGGWQPSGPSAGVDRLRWPATAAEARALLDSLPATLDGQDRQLYYSPADKEQEVGAYAGASYGDGLSVSVSQEFRADLSGTGELELFRASDLLAAGFNLVFACAEDSYQGTFPEDPDYSGPGFSDKPVTAPAWFSCKIDGAEGNDDFTGYAVGWISKKSAWLVVAADRETALLLIGALGEAADSTPSK